VKVDGEKLRVRARQSDRFEIVDKAENRTVIFYKGEHRTEIKVPQHVCKLPLIAIEAKTKKDISDSQFAQLNIEKLPETHYPVVQIRVACSKGTYIRTLAEDIGLALKQPIPAMLWQLRRTRIGDISIEQALQINDLQNLIH
jgi:tRNA U55 pseudouridine synthase TruB